MTDITSRYNSSETSVRDFYNVLFRHKRKMIAFFIALVVLITLGTFLSPKVYKSEAELLVRLGRENATVGPTVATGKVIDIAADRENEINSEVDILKSRELAEKVVDAIGAKLILRGENDSLPAGASLATAVRFWTRRAVSYPFTLLASLLSSHSASSPTGRLLEKDLAIQALMKNLDVEAWKKSNIIKVSYETNDPTLARNVLNRLVAFYLEKHIEVNRTPGSYAFFKKQQNELRFSLDRTEEELKNLKNATSVASISEQRRILLDRIGALNTELENTDSSASASEASVKSLTATLANLPENVRKNETTGFANSAADAMRRQVYELELKEQTLLSTFTESSIPVQEIRRQIRRGKALLLKAQQQNQVTTGINVNYQKIQLQLLTEKQRLASFKARAQTIKSQLKDAGAKLYALNGAEVRFGQLNRDLAIQRSNYRKYSDSLEQARIDEALDMQRISNISIVEPATYSIKPVRPKTLLALAIGVFLGIFGALGLAFFSEFKDHSIKKPEDVSDRLHLPVLAALPMVFPENNSNGLALVGQSQIQAETRTELLLGSNRNSAAVGDLLRSCLRTVPATTRVVALAGCHSGEGVSTASALLAKEFAKSSEGRVLLVDANSVAPCQHLKFKTRLSPGLSDFGSNGRPGLSYIQSATVENLDILCAGNGGQDLSPNVFKAFSEILPALRQEYSFIICDLPPVLEHSPAMRIAALMDGVVLVVEAEKTRWEIADKAREALVQADANVLGVVLNKRRFHIPDWLYKTL